MIDAIIRLFSGKHKVDLGTIIKNGALIIDVRTPSEFNEGHLKNAINIPADLVQYNLFKIQKDRPVVTCCDSGYRSTTAYRLLKACGYTQVYDGGSWKDLKQYED